MTRSKRSGPGGARRLLVRARLKGQGGVPGANRRSLRYAFGTHIQVRLEGDSSRSVFDADTRDVSGGGLGFHATRPFDVGAELLLRDGAERSNGEWFPGRVAHCSASAGGGYLIGVEFERPLFESNDPGASADVASRRRSDHLGPIGISLGLSAAACLIGAIWMLL